MKTDTTTTIRVATPEDIGTLCQIGGTTFQATFADDNTPEDMASYLRDNFSTERLTQEINDPAATFFIAEVDGNPIGYARVRRGETEACVTGTNPLELQRLYLLPESIGRGAGAALMQACIDHAKSNGFQTLWLGVWEHNERAKNFYFKWGFEPVGSHIFPLGSDMQTDLILQKSLD